MTNNKLPTFIIDCSTCKAKVAALEHGRINRYGFIDHETGEDYYGSSVMLGQCPKCSSILVGESPQTAIGGYDGPEHEWGNPIRVYPDPPKTFASLRIPKAVTESILEGKLCLQTGAITAACVMFGRALEAICRDLIKKPNNEKASTSRRPMMLGEGLRKLKQNGLIDQKLLDWSEQLHAFRNLAAHPSDTEIIREEAEDLQSFVIAIVEYIYDLTDRYNDFKMRQDKKKKELEAKL